MKAINIYHLGRKINKRPLPESMASDIYSKEYIYQKIDGKMTKIPTSQVTIIKCTVI